MPIYHKTEFTDRLAVLFSQHKLVFESLTVGRVYLPTNHAVLNILFYDLNNKISEVCIHLNPTVYPYSDVSYDFCCKFMENKIMSDLIGFVKLTLHENPDITEHDIRMKAVLEGFGGSLEIISVYYKQEKSRISIG